jgi:hypothetical protein
VCPSSASGSLSESEKSTAPSRECGETSGEHGEERKQGLLRRAEHVCQFSFQTGVREAFNRGDTPAALADHGSLRWLLHSVIRKGLPSIGYSLDSGIWDFMQGGLLMRRIQASSWRSDALGR